MNHSLYEKLKDRVKADAEREQRELEVHPEEFVVFRVKRWKEERGEDKKRGVRKDETLTLWLRYSGLALNY